MSDRDSGSDVLKMIGAGMVGALLAVGITLLVAPKCGRELRDDLSMAATDAKERVGEAARSLVDKAKGKAEQLESAVEDVTEKSHRA